MSEAAGANDVVGAAAAALRATIESPIPARFPAAPVNTSGCVVTNDTLDLPVRPCQTPVPAVSQPLIQLTIFCSQFVLGRTVAQNRKSRELPLGRNSAKNSRDL